MTAESIFMSFIARIESVEIKHTKSGQEYLSIMARAGTQDAKWWLTMYGTAAREAFAWLRPDVTAWAKGTFSLKQPEGRPPLCHCNLSQIEAVYQAAPSKRETPPPEKKAPPKTAKITFNEKTGDEIGF